MVKGVGGREEVKGIHIISHETTFQDLILDDFTNPRIQRTGPPRRRRPVRAVDRKQWCQPHRSRCEYFVIRSGLAAAVPGVGGDVDGFHVFVMGGREWGGWESFDEDFRKCWCCVGC